MNEKPNILFILTDQQHHRMMSCAGNSDLKTPSMDRLASEGVRYSRCYCANPVCIPSRFSMFTGRMPSEIGLWENKEDVGPIPDRIRSKGLGHLMASSGYEPVYAGKQHFPGMSAEDLGFEVLTKDERDVCADRCIDYLNTQKEKPFFLVASFINPHDICYMAIRDFARTEQSRVLLERGAVECAELDRALRIPEDVDEEAFYRSFCPELPANHLPQDGEPEAVEWLLRERPFKMQARNFWDERRWRMHRWAYVRLTERVDAQIGRVLDALDSGAYGENTIVVFTSDHGDHDGSHRMEHKTTFYEEADHVPLIVRHPELSGRGRVDGRLIQNGIDLLPTFCDWAGASMPDELQGTSFAVSVAGRSEVETEPQSIYMQNAVSQAVVCSGYKYVRYFEGDNAEQLYDLTSDPGQTRNFIGDPSCSEALGVCRSQMTHWMERYAIASDFAPQSLGPVE